MSRKSIGKLVAVVFMITVMFSYFLEAAEPYPGYTFFASGSKAYLYDMDKNKIHEWKASGGSVQTAAYLLPDGSALFPLNKEYCPFRPGGAHPSGTFQKVSWDGELLWDFKFCEDDFTPSYDIEPLPNGNVLVIAGYQNSSKPGKVFEIKQNGQNDGDVVWECNITSKLSGVSGYMNGVSYNPDLDQILLNIQTPGRTLAIIDHSSSDVLFKWNQGFSGRIHAGIWVSDKYLGTDIPIPDAEPDKMRVGNILTVCNGNDEVVEIDPKSNTKVKTIEYNFGSNQGGVQRLPNGNTLVTKGYSKTIDELDDNGNKVWSLSAPVTVHRAFRYGKDYPGVNPTGTVGKTSYVISKSLRIVHNHLNGQTNLYFENNDCRAIVRIFSLSGKEVFYKVNTQSSLILNTNRFPEGIYIVQVELSTGFLRKNLILVR